MATFTGTPGDDVANAVTGTLIGFTGGTVAELQDAIGDTFVVGGTYGTDPGADTVVAGAGNDIFSAFGDPLSGNALDGGTGTDTLNIYCNFNGQPMAPDLSVQNIEILSVDDRGNIGKSNTYYSFVSLTIEQAESFETIRRDPVSTDNRRLPLSIDGTGFLDLSGELGTTAVWCVVDGCSIVLGAGWDILYAGGGNDTLNGGAGADLMFGGAGDDTYYVDNSADNATERFFSAIGSGYDTAISSVSYALIESSGIERLELTGTADLNAAGNSLDNALLGNSGANVLNGKTGADEMTGRGGNDIYYVDNAGDKAIELPGGGTDRVISSVSFNILANVENLQLTGTANIDAGGNSGNNILWGNSGNNRLNGALGADRMIGGLGNDTYYVDNAGDVVTELAGQGTDNVLSSITHTLAAHVEALRLLGATAINGAGNASNNSIFGNDAANILSGVSGADALYGGLGNDMLFGGVDADMFVFNTALGATNVDRIMDFQFIDTVVLENTGAGLFNALAPGVLSAAAFASGAGFTSGKDASDRIVYNTTTGDLYYDADGSGAGAAIRFATVNGAPALTSADFLVI